MPKYKTAYYLNNENNTWEPVSYKELTNENTRAKLRDKDLRDKVNGSISLGIRNHPDTPHFFQKRLIRQNIEKGIIESEQHGKIVNYLHNYCNNKFLKHHFGYYERPWDKKDKGFDTIRKINDYSWKQEAGFGLAYGKYIIFDLLGRSQSEIALTDQLPYIAIEVVDTHFHSKEAFTALLKLSKNLPFIILYYYINKFPYLNKQIDPKRSNGYTKIRIHSYISDGSFWIRNERIEEENGVEVSPDNPSEYYNLIKERLTRDGFIRTTT